MRQLPDESFDDIVYFGASAETIEVLNDKLAASGVVNIVLGGASIGRRVAVGVGRVHYGLTRWVGTPGASAAASYSTVPSSGELRPNEKVLIVGAAGPMGQMHVVRSLCTPVEGVSVVGTDVDDARLEALRRKAEPYSRRNGVPLRLVNTAKEPLDERFSYQVVLVPAGPLVAAAVDNSLPGGLVDIFAGIPAHTRQEIDLDTYIERRCYMFGTSGSVIGDMKVLLDKVSSGQLDTNCSVDAVSGMAGAIDGCGRPGETDDGRQDNHLPDAPRRRLDPAVRAGRTFPQRGVQAGRRPMEQGRRAGAAAGRCHRRPRPPGGGASGDGAGRRASVNGDVSRGAKARQHG